MKVIRELEPEIREVQAEPEEEEEEEAEKGEEEEQAELEEEEAEESELEESFEPTPRSFSQFEREIVPALLPTDEVQETPPELEQQLENVPGAAPGEGEETAEYAPPEYETGYDTRDYSKRERGVERDREMPSLLPRREEEGEEVGMRRIDMGEWRRTTQEQGMRRRGGTLEDYSLKLRREEEKEGLPFERKTKKRRLNI